LKFSRDVVCDLTHHLGSAVLELLKTVFPPLTLYSVLNCRSVRGEAKTTNTRKDI